MRDAEEVIDDIVSAIIDCYEPDPGMAKAKPILEADRREARLEVLRNVYDRCCRERHLINAINRINDMMIELEKGYPDGED